MKDYSNLIPEELCNKAPVLNEHEFLCLGSETILFLSKYWKNVSSIRMGKSIGNNDLDEYLMHADEAQECRKKSELLAELAIRAESKPQIFHPAPYLAGERVTCFIQDTSDDPACSGHLVDAVVMRVLYHDSGARSDYWIRPTRKNVSSTKEYFFRADNVSIFQWSDMAYLRTHPNFFRRLLELRAANDDERAKIDSVLAATYS